MKESKDKKTNKIKRFFSQLVNKLDSKMEEKAKSSSCCCKPTDKRSGSCCS
jgi:hypothetical protein